MIYCVRFRALEEHLYRLGFALFRATSITRVYRRGAEAFTIRAPNVNGDLPEIIVDEALNGAGLPVPAWDVHWCD